MTKSAAVRIREPKREGQEVTFVVAEDSLPPEHPARLFWTIFGDFDLSGFVVDAKAVVGRAGRRVYSPRMMLTLWSYALYDGVAHAREIARRIHRDVTYRWIVGDLDVGRARISEFLAANRPAMLDLLADVLGVLMDAGLLFLPDHRLAQDGTRVRADAARGSFRTLEALATTRAQATLHLKAVLAQLDEPPLGVRAEVARARGACDVLDRLKAATTALQEVQAVRAKATPKRGKKPVGAATGSTTDPDARLLKFADGGFAPGYNLQFGVVGDPRGGPLAIVGVQVTNRGTDKDSLAPMRRHIAAQTGCTPVQVVVDAEHLTLDEVRRAAVAHLDVIRTVPEHWTPDGPEQDDVTRAWMARMATEEARAIYRGRKALPERVNAMVQTWLPHGRLPVRGLERVEGFAWLLAIVINLREHRQHWLN